MTPVTITPEQRDVAEDYWGVPWTQLSGPQIKEALSGGLFWRPWCRSRNFGSWSW